MFKEEIRKVLSQVLKAADIEVAMITVEYPADPKHGDYATNVALVAAKKLGKNPKVFAEEFFQCDLGSIIKCSSFVS